MSPLCPQCDLSHCYEAENSIRIASPPLKSVRPSLNNRKYLILHDSYGAKVACECKRKIHDPGTLVHGAHVYTVANEVFEKRVTNTGREISGRSHLKNKILQRSVKDEILKAKDGAGNKFYFDKPHGKHRVPLLRHVKANGNQVVYGYNKDVFPSTITTLNKEQSQLNKLTLRQQKMGNQVRYGNETCFEYDE